ncbi:MAG TPA: hypothetical protein VGG16_21020 [Streptosporangiaceae bacterium]
MTRRWLRLYDVDAGRGVHRDAVLPAGQHHVRDQDIINLLSGGFVTNVLAVVNVALYLTYGPTCVAVLIAADCAAAKPARTAGRPSRGLEVAGQRSRR